jgi:hypothetical protein
MRPVLRRVRLRPLNEAEAYARCHGERNTEVKIVHLEPRRPRYTPRVSGEDLRNAFEQKLEQREPAPEPVSEAVSEPVSELVPGLTTERAPV